MRRLRWYGYAARHPAKAPDVDLGEWRVLEPCGAKEHGYNALFEDRALGTAGHTTLLGRQVLATRILRTLEAYGVLDELAAELR